MRDLLRWLLDLAHRLTRGLDWPLLLALGALRGIGRAVQDSAGGSGLVMAQGARFAVGLAAMWALSRVTPTRLRAWTPGVFAVALLPFVALGAAVPWIRRLPADHRLLTTSALAPYLNVAWRFGLVVIPILYYVAYRRQHAESPTSPHGPTEADHGAKAT